MLREAFAEFLPLVTEAVRRHYADNLVALAVFGSVGRGTPRSDSDIDLLIICRRLPQGRMKRVDDFMAVEDALAPALRDLAGLGIHTTLSPVIKTPEEALQGSHLFLDMTEDARILHDPEGFLAGLLGQLRERLASWGAKRVRHGSAWYWIVKPDAKPGEVWDL